MELEVTFLGNYDYSYRKKKQTKRASQNHLEKMILILISDAYEP